MLVESQMCDVCCSITNQRTLLFQVEEGLMLNAKGWIDKALSHEI